MINGSHHNLGETELVGIGRSGIYREMGGGGKDRAVIPGLR